MSGDTLRIAFYINANSLIEAELRVGEQTILGTFINPKGRKAEVRLTGLSANEVNALRADATQAGGPMKGDVGGYPAQGCLAAGPGSRIVLGYVGAVNCPACRGYEAEYFGRMEKMKVSLPAFYQIDYITIKSGGFRGVVWPQDLPPCLSWAGGDRPDGRPILQNHGTLSFWRRWVSRSGWRWLNAHRVEHESTAPPLGGRGVGMRVPSIPTVGIWRE